MIKKVDLSDLLLEPQADNRISSKKLHFILFIIVIIIIGFIYSLIDKEKVKTNNIAIKKEIVLKKKEHFIINKPLIKSKNTSSSLIITASTRYIQVAAFPNTTKDISLIRKLKINGYSYKILKGDRYTRILVGPYNNFDEAKINISNIKENIRKDSFITSKF